MKTTGRYADYRARRLATNGRVALVLALPPAAFDAIALVGSGGRLFPLHVYMAVAVLSLAVIAVSCLVTAPLLGSRGGIVQAAEQRVPATAGVPATAPGRRPAGASAADVAAAAPRVPTRRAPVAEVPEPALTVADLLGHGDRA